MINNPNNSFNNNRILFLLSIGLILLSLETIIIQKTHTPPTKQEIQKEKQTQTTESIPGIFYLENGEIDTSDWLTYRNEEYGFEFRYPKEWEVREEKNTIVFKPIGANPTQPIDFGINIYTSLNEFWDFKDEKTIEEYTTARTTNGIFKELEKIQINDITAISLKEYSNYLSSNFQKIFFEKGQYIFAISFRNDTSLKNNKQYQRINKNILKSFHFLDPLSFNKMKKDFYHFASR